MNELREQCINLLTERFIENAFQENEVSHLLASLFIFGKNYSVSDWPLEELLRMVEEEFRDEFQESELGKNDDVPERTRLENWIMEQDAPNWYGRV